MLLTRHVAVEESHSHDSNFLHFLFFVQEQSDVRSDVITIVGSFFSSGLSVGSS